DIIDQESRAKADSAAMLSPGTDVQDDDDGREPRRKHATHSSTESVVPAGPATRRLARELGVDISQVPGSAHGERVTPEDVKAYVRGLATNARSADSLPAVPALPDFERWGQIERQPLTGIRRKTAEQMSLAWRMIPHVTQHDQADITDLESFRKQQESKGP